MKKRLKIFSWALLSLVLLNSCKKHEYAPNEIPLTPSQGLLFLKVYVNGKEGRFLLDTGANMSYVNETKLGDFDIRVRGEELDTELTGIGGQSSSVYELFKFKMHTSKGEEFPNNIDFRGTDLSKIKIRVDGIIGGDYLRKNKAIIDYTNNSLVLNGHLLKDPIK